ncbi:NADH:ubiquinone oxidoreductase [Tulasnella sp. 403]|nr:NADH:ubiquinone oxidoreductase [Tulasnella sp. 403]
MSFRVMDADLGNDSPNFLSPYDGDDAGSIDWHQKYLEVKELLDETRDELEEFRVSSQELEDELERELQRTENTQQELRDEVERLKNDREEWKTSCGDTAYIDLAAIVAYSSCDAMKVKYKSANDTATKIQLDLNAQRQALITYKSQVVQLELGNDDLERNERAATASFKDLELRFTQLLEEKILVESELSEKLALQEENQRLKDELRDALAELNVLQIRLEASKVPPNPPPVPTPTVVVVEEPPNSPLDIPSTDLPAPSHPRPPRSHRPVLAAIDTSIKPLPHPPSSTQTATLSASIPRSRRIAKDINEKTKLLQAKIGTGLPKLKNNIYRSTSSGRAIVNSASAFFIADKVDKDSRRVASARTPRRSFDRTSSSPAYTSSGWVVVHEADTPRANRVRPPVKPDPDDDYDLEPDPPMGVFPKPSRARVSFDSSVEIHSASDSRKSSFSSYASSLKPHTPPGPPSSFRVPEKKDSAPSTPSKLSAFSRSISVLSTSSKGNVGGLSSYVEPQGESPVASDSGPRHVAHKRSFTFAIPRKLSRSPGPKTSTGSGFSIRSGKSSIPTPSPTQGDWSYNEINFSDIPFPAASFSNKIDGLPAPSTNPSSSTSMLSLSASRIGIPRGLSKSVSGKQTQPNLPDTKSVGNIPVSSARLNLRSSRIGRDAEQEGSSPRQPTYKPYYGSTLGRS